MILSLDLDSEVRIYLQIRNRIVEAIASGELVEGSSLPSTRRLAVDLGINFHTVNKAYDLLRREGLLRINRKSGALVQRDARTAPPQPGFTDEWETRLRTLLAEAVAHGVGDPAVLDSCGSVLTSFTSSPLAAGGPHHGTKQGDSVS
ncbi:GntR family transcriptional regulator [Streptomyces lydicus]|uniref:GntR family transcriptional regulator n=1 Tax=Streptomyces lydicus TaxID=47763 RepID=A0A3Q9K641_9ACTN|nr:GntR family transcriptional regulator [Streptomyces lydicus]AZS69848.1 GntR family transcriptional regulator [Streptomyces lydicus]